MSLKDPIYLKLNPHEAIKALQTHVLMNLRHLFLQIIGMTDSRVVWQLTLRLRSVKIPYSNPSWVLSVIIMCFHSSYSDFIPQSTNMHVVLTGVSKLTMKLRMSIWVCFVFLFVCFSCFYVSLRWTVQGVPCLSSIDSWVRSQKIN